MDYGNHTLEAGDIVTLNMISGIWQVTTKYRRAFEKQDQVDVKLVATDGLLPPPVAKTRTKQYVGNVHRVLRDDLDGIMDQIRTTYRQLSESIRD